MVRPNKLTNSKSTDRFVVEKDNYSGVYKLMKINQGGRWVVAFEYDIKDLSDFIKEKDIFLYNFREYNQMLQEE